MEDGRLRDLVQQALDEDLGGGDVTTEAVVSPDAEAVGEIGARATGVISGIAVASAVFRQLDPEVAIVEHVAAGGRVAAGNRVLEVRGRARAILSGERVALNFLQRLSGIATLTRAYVEATMGTDARIYDTRKTTPLLRALEKEAVRDGGGENHRMDLHDQAMIKENHLAFLPEGDERALASAMADARDAAGSIVVEATSRDGALQAAHFGADVVLLDNFDLEDLPDVIGALRALPGGGPQVEVSGGVDLSTVRAIAEAGPDRISVGALTHSAPSLDLSLDVRPGTI